MHFSKYIQLTRPHNFDRTKEQWLGDRSFFYLSAIHSEQMLLNIMYFAVDNTCWIKPDGG
jgi:hypothetical protein